MTTGTFTNLVVKAVGSTSCSSSSTVRNGYTKNWTGIDSATVWKPKPVDFLGNVAKFYVKERYPNRVDLVKIAEIASQADQSVFDHAREVRFRYPKPPLPGKGDYGVPHPYSVTWAGYREGVFRYTLSGVNYTGTVSNCGYGPSAFKTPKPWGPSDEWKLLSRLRTKITGSEFNLATFLGAEGRDTIRFLGETANRVYRAQLAMRRADVNAAYQILREWGRVMPSSKRTRQQLSTQQDIYQELLDSLVNQRRSERAGKRTWLDVPARQWLEYHLAIEPLLSDVRSAAEQLSHMVDTTHTMRYTTSVRRVMPHVNESQFDSRWAINFLERRVGIVAYFTQTPDPKNFLGFQNPEVVIWNAIPLSFVSDYVFPIGEWLEAHATRRALPTGLYVRSDKSRRFVRNLKGKASAFVDPDDGLYQASWSGSFDRTISSSLDVPRPRVIPLGQALESWQRAATVVALIVASGPDRVRYVSD